MILSVAQYMLAVEHLEMMSRTLCKRKIYPLRNEKGELKCYVGNSAIIFEVMCEGAHSALRVYMQNHPNLGAIYGERYLPKELLVCSTEATSTLADVVLCEWYDGPTLQSKIEEYCQNRTKMEALSHLFEEFAISLLKEPWAHGDLKPENIILCSKKLQLIDLDACYLPEFKSTDCVEVGTRQYQHPYRDKSSFSKSIDDYPIALIVTALAALAAEPKLSKRVRNSDTLLITPQLAVAGKDEVLKRIENLFAKVGDVRHYRIAKMLRSPYPALPQLKALLEAKPTPSNEGEELTLEYYNGGWGYSAKGKFVIPPYYDLAFDFSEGLGLVRVADVWHFINRRGEVVIRCGRGEQIKPFRNGMTCIKRTDGEYVIYSNGKIEKLE